MTTDYDEALASAANLDVELALTPPDAKEANPERLVWLDPTDDEGNLNPWGQQPDELDTHYAYFQYYCSLPAARRTYIQVERHYGEVSNHITKIAKVNDWKVRVREWDDERARIYQLEIFDELREMGEIQGAILRDSIEALAIPLQVMAERMRDDPDAVLAELGEKSLVQLHAMSIKSARGLPNLMQTERLVRGLPTEITANVHSGKVDHVHTPNLSEVAEILQGLADAGAISFDGGRVIETGEVVDAEVEPIRSDEADT